MAPTVAEILAHYEDDEALVERISHRAVKPPIAIVDPNPEWPKRYEEAKQRIQKALGEVALDIVHVGSTSVPGLPAKDIIDVDVTVEDITDEAVYVKLLEDAGYQFLLREPHWHNHRFFVEARPGAYNVNVHVWGPDCVEAAKHRIFRDWLRKTPADVELYAKAKREAAEETARTGDSILEYNQRKEKTINEIYQRAFRDLGYIE